MIDTDIISDKSIFMLHIPSSIRLLYNKTKEGNKGF